MTKYHRRRRFIGSASCAGVSDVDTGRMSMPLWIATGIALGTGLGAMMENAALGIAVGAGLGGAIGAWSRRQGPSDKP